MRTFDRRAIVAPSLAEGVAPVRALLEAGDVFTDERIDPFIAPTRTEVLRDATTPHPIAFVHDHSPRRERGWARCPVLAW